MNTQETQMKKSLNKKWQELRTEASTQNILIPISDIVRQYNRGNLNINPAYQRAYRWSNEQKSKFIESLLLKYPIPPVIAIMTENPENGLPNLEIIDGLQRISTILEFMEDEVKENKRVENTNEKFEKIIGLETFKEINGKTWQDFIKEDFEFVFDSTPLLFVNFTSNNEDVKFDVFERINTLATELSPQEIRNSVLALKNKSKFIEITAKIREESQKFIGDPNLMKSQDMEFFLEFSLIKNSKKYLPKINKKIKESLKIKTKDKSKHLDLLLSTYTKILSFETLNDDLNDYLSFLELNKELYFKKYDLKKDETGGGPIKFFFEILCFLYFKDKSLITKDFYKKYFSENYHDILKKLGKNNPNAKDRFELAKKLVEGYKGHDLFCL